MHILANTSWHLYYFLAINLKCGVVVYNYFLFILVLVSCSSAFISSESRLLFVGQDNGEVQVLVFRFLFMI